MQCGFFLMPLQMISICEQSLAYRAYLEFFSLRSRILLNHVIQVVVFWVLDKQTLNHLLLLFLALSECLNNSLNNKVAVEEPSALLDCLLPPLTLLHLFDFSREVSVHHLMLLVLLHCHRRDIPSDLLTGLHYIRVAGPDLPPSAGPTSRFLLPALWRFLLILFRLQGEDRGFSW